MVLAFLRAPTNVRFGVSAFALATGGSSAATMTRIPAKNGARLLGALPMKLATTALALKLAPISVPPGRMNAPVLRVEFVPIADNAPFGALGKRAIRAVIVAAMAAVNAGKHNRLARKIAATTRRR